MYPDSGSGWIEELLNNNHAPSDQAAQEVKGLLLQPLKYLEDLDSQILELRNRLSELESKRNETQNQIFRYQSILAPIRRVPPDVLGEIFYQCLPTHRNPIMKSSDCPLLLTRICSLWRATAVSTPKLWDRIYITFADYDTVPSLETVAEMIRSGELAVEHGEDIDMWRDGQPNVDKERTTELLRRRYEAVMEWILRSGTRPLSISIQFTSAFWYTVPYSERPPSVTMELLSFLASLAPRWKTFELDGSFDIYKALEDMLPVVSQMAMLTSFKAKCLSYYQVSTRPSGLKLLDAPNLHRISLSMGYDTIWGDVYRSLKQWDKLTHISCSTSSSFSDEDTLFLFEHATNLVHYQGFIDPNRFGNTHRAYEGLISLPFLRSLSITENVHPQIAARVFTLMEAPKLQRVEYSSAFYDSSVSSQSFSPTPIAILPLLQRSTELESLSLQLSNLPIWDVGAVLRAVPLITDLVIGGGRNRPTLDYIRPVGHTDYTVSGLSYSSRGFQVSDLIVDNTDILLPRLKSLSIANLSISISDDTLFDLIKSRIKSSKAASLTHFKAFLFRDRQRNIIDELTAYAESVGVKINLDINYAQKRHSTQIPISADFRLPMLEDVDEWS